MLLHQAICTVNSEHEGDISLKFAFLRNKAPIRVALSQKLQAGKRGGDLSQGLGWGFSMTFCGFGLARGRKMSSERKP